jgi:hypothetical protein
MQLPVMAAAQPADGQRLAVVFVMRVGWFGATHLAGLALEPIHGAGQTPLQYEPSGPTG